MASEVSPLNILFIGAGGIVFGNDWVPWNHSLHLEKILGSRLNVLGIVDPSHERFTWVVDKKKGALPYSNMRHFTSVQEAATSITTPIHLIILASPPQYRGSPTPGQDLEMQILTAFGSSPAIFAEKPVTMHSAQGAHEVGRRLAASGNLVGVGYMMRYLKVVQKAMQILRENRLVVMSVSARYVSAYSRMRKAEWWDKEKQGGPIVEQATHFCDLCRYLGGEVELDSVRATALEFDEPAGRLGHFHEAVDEGGVPPGRKIPRATSAVWKYDTGAVGSLTHTVALHGVTYSNEITIVADGYQLRLVDLYKEPRLYVRTPEGEEEVKYSYPGDNPFFNELQAICRAQDQRRGNAMAESTDELLPGSILSSFEDATKTYEFSWRIRLESESRP